MAQYSYLFKWEITNPKYGIKKGDTDFYPKKKGDELVKKGVLSFVGKYALKLDPKTGGTILAPVK